MKLLFLIMLCINAFALEVKVTTNPEMPVKDETFRLIFEIKSNESQEPVISFNPLGLEISGKQNMGTTTRTTYINGKLSTDRTVTIAYDAIAKRTGSVYVRDIKVTVGKETEDVATLRKTVLNEPRRAREIFALAQVDKDEAFVNESILVRYYLYNKVNVTTTDIIKFPELDKMMKRFHQEKMRPERVKYKGEIYMRRVIYTAQVFAQKPGTYNVDPLIMNVRYTNSVDPFDNLGFGGGFGRRRSMEIKSKPIKLKIKKLPINNVPASFTGLVGKHSFKIKLNKSRFVVNEPIEIKLQVEGEGALELFERPKLLLENSIEEFEVSSDLQLGANFDATKTFDYTYLGRKNIDLEAKSIELSYFDPKTLKFEKVFLELPKILIAGGVSKNDNLSKVDNTNNQNKSSVTNEIINADKFNNFEPLYIAINTYRYNAFKIAIVTFFIALILLVFRFRDYIMKLLSRDREEDIFDLIKKNGISYSELYKVVHELGRGQDMIEIVSSSGLDKDTKSYLKNLILYIEKRYKAGKKGKVKVDKKRISKVKNYLSQEDQWI